MRPRKSSLLLLLAVLIVSPVTAQRSSERNPIDLVADARVRLVEGRERFDEEALSEAIDLARQGLNGNPQYAEAHLILAEAHLWLQDLTAAQTHIDAAIDLGYGGSELLLLAARTAVLSGEFQRGAEIFQSILQREPYNEGAQVGVALLRLIDGTTTLERRELARLESRYPENRQLLVALIEMSYRDGDRDAVERYLEPALRYHSESASVQYIAAANALRNGNLTAASVHGRNAVTIAPSFGDGWLLLAEIARRQGEIAAAKAHYETLIRLQPDNYRAWYARGVLAHTMADYENAIRSWERARSIRPEYELPLLATEHDAMERLPLESDRRQELSSPYLEIGRELEDRYLFRQAEQIYRGGLQIYPYNLQLRRSLAEMYRNQEQYARYLQELEIISQLGGESQEIIDLIEIYRDLLRDSLGRTWGIDQFVAERPLTRLLITYTTASDALEPMAGDHVTRYIERLAQSSQNIEILPSVGIARYRPNEIVREGRIHSSNVTVGLNYKIEERRILIEYSIFIGRSIQPVETGVVLRSGNDRIRNASRELVARVENRVVPNGYVLDRRFEQVLIGIGTVDGVTPGDEVELFARPEDERLGTATVIAVDDLLAVVEWDPTGTDRLGVGDRAVYLGPPPDEEEEDENDADGELESETETLDTNKEVTIFEDLVQQVFQVR